MSTATRSPFRPKALVYLRERVRIRAAVYVSQDEPPSQVLAKILPAAGDRSGVSVEVTVRLVGGVWDCSECPGATSCAHRLAVQIPTGYEHLSGAWRLSPDAREDDRDGAA